VNRKGNVEDLIGIVVVAIVLSVVIFLVYSIIGNFNTAIQDIPGVSSSIKTLSTNNYSRFPAVADKAFALFLFLFPLISIIGAYYIDSSPVFAIFSFILFGMMLMMGMVFGNVYHSFVTDGNFVGFTTTFPIINWFMSNFVYYLAFTGFFIMLALYAKPQRGPV
jgi:hypothetical protein